MDFYKKKILTAEKTQDGVIFELKAVILGNQDKERIAELCEVYTEAQSDIEYYTKRIKEEAAKAEEVKQ